MEQSNSKRKSIWRRALDHLVELAREEDPPHRLAFGAALGMLVGIVPIMGIQMPVVTAIALPLRANIKAAILGVWITNPLTVIPIYWVDYRFGLLFTGTEPVGFQRFGEIVQEVSAWDWSNMGDSLARILHLSGDLLAPLFTGGAILGAVLAVPTYFLTHRFVTRYRARRAENSLKSQAEPNAGAST